MDANNEANYYEWRKLIRSHYRIYFLWFCFIVFAVCVKYNRYLFIWQRRFSV